MEPSKEPISVRITRLNKVFLSQPGAVSSLSSRHFFGREGLLDSLMVLYDECNNDVLKKDKIIGSFVKKFHGIVSELKRLRVNLSDFQVKKVIGRGHFGEVNVVREKQTGDVYAMKVLKKCEALSQEGAFCYQEERDIMAQTSSPWLTRLQYAFQDMNNLYLVMQFHPGGDLLTLLDRFDGAITEEMARFYLAELAMGISDLHSMGYVHRDIKPANILLDRCGHLKLADFGSAARLTPAGVVTSSVIVGTPEYIAPEVLESLNNASGGKHDKQKLYGIECDYWSLGIVAYEMVVGHTPFFGEHISIIYNDIMNHENAFNFPDHVSFSSEFCKFIAALLVRAENRLNHEKLQKHSFFSKIDWSGLVNCVPPFVPVVTSEDDTSNFASLVRPSPRPALENVTVQKEFSGKNLPFIGFTCTPEIGLPQIKADPAVENKTTCESKRKEVEDLQRRLENSEAKLEESTVLRRKLEMCYGKLKGVEDERSALEHELIRSRHKTQCLQRTLDLERAQRSAFEVKVKAMITESKASWEAKTQDDLDFLLKEIESKNETIAALQLEKQELGNKLLHSGQELNTLEGEVQRLRECVDENRRKMMKVQKKTCLSMAGVETCLKEIMWDKQHFVVMLQQQLESVLSRSTGLKNQLNNLKQKSRKRIDKILSEHDNVVYENKKLLQEVEEYKSKCMETEELLEGLKKDLAKETSQSSDLKATLQTEKESNCKLREQLKMARKEKQEVELARDQGIVLVSGLEKQMALLKEEVEILRPALQQKLNEDETYIATQELHLQKQNEYIQDRLMQLEEENKNLKQQITLVKDSAALKCEDAGNKMAHQKEFLEQQVGRLESQLEKLREKDICGQQTLRNVYSDMFKKDKELSAIKLDLRIAVREKKTAEEALRVLRLEKEQLVKEKEEENKTLSDELSEGCSKFTALQEDFRTLKAELTDKERKIFELNQKLEVEKSEKAVMQNSLGAIEALLKAAEAETVKMKQSEKGLELKVLSLQSEVSRLKQLNEELRKYKSYSSKVLEEYKSHAQELEVSNKTLTETCKMLEEQLQDFEKLVETYESEEKNLASKITERQREMEHLQTELENVEEAKRMECSAHRKTREKLHQTENEVSSQKEIISTLQAQLEDKERLVASLSGQVTFLEQKYEEVEVELQSARRTTESLQQEQIGLKEELTHYLTSVENLRIMSIKQGQDLEKGDRERRELQDRLYEMSVQLEDQRVHHEYRTIKADATIQQQTKLIDFLQHNLNEQGKKKKIFTGRLFGRQKENIAPGMMCDASRDPGVKLAQERDKARIQKKELGRSRVRFDLEDRSNDVGLLGVQQCNDFERDPIPESAQLTNPHRFQPRLSMRVGKCSVCLDNIHFGRYAAVCQICNVAAHTKCSLMMPATCGMHHHSPQNRNTNESDSCNSQSSPSKYVEGYVKLPNQTHSGWENRYLRLNGTALEVYLSEEKSGVKPDYIFDLCPPDCRPRVLSAVPYSDVIGTASCDLPFIFKVEVIPNTCVAKCESLLIMALSFPEKQKWVQALEKIVRQRCALAAYVTYTGQSIFRSSQDCHALDVHCCMELKNKAILVGAQEGLFYLRPEDTVVKLRQIHGVVQVYQIGLLPSIGIIVMIAGEERSLLEANVLQLETAAEAIEWSKPSLDFRSVFPVTSCHLFASNSASRKDNKAPIILCVATSEKIILLKSSEQNIFIPIKMLDTSDPCSCMHFTPHSVIVGCNKFFEIDLKNYFVEEFMDANDPSLQFLIVENEQINNFPVAILDVSLSQFFQQPEYLLCFNALGVFVDENGRRTRDDEVKWSHLPLAFVYRHPFILIFHFDSVEIMKLSPSSFIHEKDTSSSSADYASQIFIGFDQPRFLGFAEYSSAIFLSICSEGKADIRIIDAAAVYKDYDSSSFTLSDDSGSAAFTLTSSLVDLLDEESDDGSQDNNNLNTSCI